MDEWESNDCVRRKGVKEGIGWMNDRTGWRENKLSKCLTERLTRWWTKLIAGGNSRSADLLDVHTERSEWWPSGTTQWLSDYDKWEAEREKQVTGFEGQRAPLELLCPWSCPDSVPALQHPCSPPTLPNTSLDLLVQLSTISYLPFWVLSLNFISWMKPDIWLVACSCSLDFSTNLAPVVCSL